MNFLVVSKEKADLIRARWWRVARRELIWWCILFFLTYLALGAGFGVPLWVVAFFGAVELILVSRLALWVMVAAAFIGAIIGSSAAAIGHPIYRPEPIVWIFMICSASIVARFMFWLMYGRKIRI